MLSKDPLLGPFSRDSRYEGKSVELVPGINSDHRAHLTSAFTP
ncbi:hypothetical protein LEMLEM_LOCUS15085, partial [Lemmus lemmus]